MALRYNDVRAVTTGIALAAAAACSGVSDPPDPPGIAGGENLVAVKGLRLPCCARTDSTGMQITFVSGSLALEEAAPEPYAATPAGWMPAACVHEVPNGAHVDTAGVVTLPDGTTYRIPSCVELHHARFTMVITRRYEDESNGSSMVSDTSSGVYAWTDGEGGGTELISLLNVGFVGRITASDSGVSLTVGRSNFGRGAGMTPSDPEFEFFR